VRRGRPLGGPSTAGRPGSAWRWGRVLASRLMLEGVEVGARPGTGMREDRGRRAWSGLRTVHCLPDAAVFCGWRLPAARAGGGRSRRPSPGWWLGRPAPPTVPPAIAATAAASRWLPRIGFCRVRSPSGPASGGRAVRVQSSVGDRVSLSLFLPPPRTSLHSCC
jgi:hypothetical protein